VQIPRWRRNPWCCAASHFATINLQRASWLLLVRLNLGFFLRENLPLCASYLPLGVPNGRVHLRASDSPIRGRPPPHMVGGIPTSSGNPSLGRFPTIWKVLGSGLIRRLVVQHLGLPPIYRGAKGRGPATPKPPPWPPPIVAGHPLSPNPSAPLLHHIPHA
jgi:hypothetical protein